MEHTEPKPVVIFTYAGRFGHFLRAEASASALSYPLPPRTVLLGVLGAVLGLEKDTPQLLLKDALIAVSGAQVSTHWHRAKFRKDPPATLPLRIKVGAKGSDAPEKATLIKQEWLLKPSFKVTVSLSEPHHSRLVQRLKERAWYYSPSLGLSEMTATLDFVTEGEISPLGDEQTLSCHSVVTQAHAAVDGQALLEDKLELQVIRMPREVTSERVFSHTNYLAERRGRPIPVRTARAWRLVSDVLEPRHIMFL